jgi:FkbM family methyltransferase
MINGLLQVLSSKNKTKLHKLGQKLGLEIRLTGPSARDDLRLARMLSIADVELVLDVGANRGQFAQELQAAGFMGEIISFEPIPEIHAELKLIAERQPGGRWKTTRCVALSDREGISTFNINRADTTSSLLCATAESEVAMPGVAGEQVITVQTSRLDSFIEELSLRSRRFFIKIDVQGAEALVLAGATEALGLAIGLVVEVSLKELYLGQPLSHDIESLLRSKGFDIFDIIPGYRDPESLRLYQYDAIFFRPSNS